MKLFTIISTLVVVIFLSYFYCAPKASLAKENSIAEQNIMPQSSTEQGAITKKVLVKTENNTIYLEFSVNDRPKHINKNKKVESPSFFERALMFNDQLQMWISSIKSIFNRESQSKSYSAMRC